MLNWIWLGLILIAVLLAGLTGKFDDVTVAAFDASKNAVMQLALPLAGIMALWLGVMRLAEKAGLVQIVASWLRPVLIWLFPEVPAKHPAMGSILMNMAANMLGLSNAATPLGLRAMQDLQKLNLYRDTASNAMCTFLAINTSSVQLIPATAIALLAAAGSVQPTAIVGTAFIATICSTAAAIIAVKSFEKLPYYRLPAILDDDRARVAEELKFEETELTEAQAHPLGWKGKAALIAFGGIFIWVFISMIITKHGQGRSWVVATVEAVSVVSIPLILAIFPLFAALKRVPVYEEFVEGAKEGFQVALRIIPYLVAILVAISMFRAAGGIQLISDALSPILSKLFVPSELLPLLFVRPLSGSGAIGIFSELAQTHGGDSLIARMAATVIGSTETTFYVIAVYFGSVSIKRTRHAVPAGLIADAAGMIAAIIICNLVFS